MIRAEPYALEHQRSKRPVDRRIRPASLMALLRWAHAQYVAETPNLEHAVNEVAEDGDPVMRYSVKAYLALNHSPHDQYRDSPDVWVRVASKVDEDGMYRTPLRRAMEMLPHERRILARDLVPELYRPSDVALLHGIPEWCAGDVLYRTLVMLWDRYQDRPIPKVGYLERSEAQRSAEAVAVA